MTAVTVKEMRDLEAAVMDAGTSEAELMEQAGSALGRMIGVQFSGFSKAVAYLGKGHNAGDALIAMRVLREKFGWEVGVRAACEKEDCAELTRKQWDVLRPLEAEEIEAGTLLIDGLVGIGAKGALREPLAGLAREMEELRQTRACMVVAVDVPSGVDPDNGEVFEGAVTADRTYLIGAAKVGLLKGSAANAVGALALVPVAGLEGKGNGAVMIAPQTMDFGKSPRPFDFHKGMAGRVGILAGSEAYTGAALISVLGAIRAAAGLVTLYAPSVACDAIRQRLPLEAMLRACDDPRELLEERHDALVVGPGLDDFSEGYCKGFAELVQGVEVPMVIDAGGLDLVRLAGVGTDSRHVLTPHPGEFRRLRSDLADMAREEAARDFTKNCESVLLLKGARTLIAHGENPLWVNSTGTPTMSNGGQGDLLAGAIGALLAGGLANAEAAAMGAWLCGHAAELALAEKGCPSIATDVASYLGRARTAWQFGKR